jgi:predicted dehydrogenase
MSKLRVAVIGVGHLGKEHARVYAGMSDVELVAVVDTNKTQRETISKVCNTRFFGDYKEVMDNVDAVSIAVPTRLHYQIAKDFLATDIHVLVEKPMSSTLAEARELVEISKGRKAVFQVGYIERFNPAIMAIHKHPIKPRFIECHRLRPFTFRSADIGAVFDLMVHDIDIIMHLADSKVKKIDAFGMNMISEKEDIANARILFENGCIANLTASRVALAPMRKIRIFSEDTYISLDFQKREALKFKKSPNLTIESLNIKEKDVSSIADLKNFDFGDLLQIERLPMDNYEPLQKELESFVECIQNGKKPLVSGEDGMATLEVATYITNEIEKTLNAVRGEKK